METVHADWLNQNSLRAYPFEENSSRRPSDGAGNQLPKEYALPDYLLVDFIATVPHDLYGRMYMSQMSLAGSVMTLVFSSYDGEIVGAAVARLSQGMGQNEWVPFSGSGRYADVRGAVVIGDGARAIANIPDGAYSFGRDATALEPRCVRPAVASVSSISVVDQGGTERSPRLQGDVSLVAGENIRLRYDPSLNAVWIDADPDAGYREECDCGTDDTSIKTINGVSSENVDIVGGDCVKVTVSNGQVKIEDTCSKPCCGCEELTWLNNKANEISTAVSRLRGFADKISDRMDSIVDVGMINGTLADRDRYTPYHEVDQSLRSSPNWSVETKNEHMANHDDAISSRLLGQHVDYGPYIDCVD